MKRIECSAVVVLAALSLAAAACGQPLTTSEETQTAVAVGSAVATTTASPATTTTPDATAFPTAVLPTPSSAGDAMLLGGTIWVDARPARGEVLAYVDGKLCGRGQSGLVQADPPNLITSFVIRIESDTAVPGCGTPGAQVTLTVGGRSLNQPVIWQPGFRQPSALRAGPAFAIYYGELRVNEVWPRFSVLPYISGTPCGMSLVANAVDAATIAYQVAVDPDELTAGCGQAGATVELHLVVDGQPDVVFATPDWDTRGSVRVPTVDMSGQAPTPSTTVIAQ